MNVTSILTRLLTAKVRPPWWPWNVSRAASAQRGAWCPAAVAKAPGDAGGIEMGMSRFQFG